MDRQDSDGRTRVRQDRQTDRTDSLEYLSLIRILFYSGTSPRPSGADLDNNITNTVNMADEAKLPRYVL